MYIKLTKSYKSHLLNRNYDSNIKPNPNKSFLITRKYEDMVLNVSNGRQHVNINLFRIMCVITDLGNKHDIIICPPL